MKTFKVKAFFDKECFRWCAWGQHNCSGLFVEEDSFDKLLTTIKSLIQDMYETDKFKLDLRIKETVTGPPEYTTAEICLKAVKENGRALKDVPKKLRKEVCRRLASSLADRESGADSHN